MRYLLHAILAASFLTVLMPTADAAPLAAPLCTSTEDESTISAPGLDGVYYIRSATPGVYGSNIDPPTVDPGTVCTGWVQLWIETNREPGLQDTRNPDNGRDADLCVNGVGKPCP